MFITHKIEKKNYKNNNLGLYELEIKKNEIVRTRNENIKLQIGFWS